MYYLNADKSDILRSSSILKKKKKKEARVTLFVPLETNLIQGPFLPELCSGVSSECYQRHH